MYLWIDYNYIYFAVHYILLVSLQHWQHDQPSDIQQGLDVYVGPGVNVLKHLNLSLVLRQMKNSFIFIIVQWVLRPQESNLHLCARILLISEVKMESAVKYPGYCSGSQPVTDRVESQWCSTATKKLALQFSHYHVSWFQTFHHLVPPLHSTLATLLQKLARTSLFCSPFDLVRVTFCDLLIF